MAIGTTPLFSELSGSCGPVDFRTRRNNKIEIGKKRIPANPQSARQLEVRAGYGRLHELWQNASYIDKAQYERLGELYHISAWNAFLLRHQSAMSAAPVASWGMVESSGLDLHDLTTNENTGTIFGATWKELQQTKLSYLSFDGSDDYVNCGHDTSLDCTTAITFMMWTKFAKLPSEYLINYPRVTRKQDAYGLMLGMSDGNILFKIFDSTGTAHFSYFQESEINITMWQHISATYDGITQKIYLNGIPHTSCLWADTIRTSANDFYLAGTPGSHYHGDIGETIILQTPLTQTQILNYINNTKHLYGV